MTLHLKNANIISDNNDYIADVIIENSIIKSIDQSIANIDNAYTIDCSEFYVTPGLIDLQFNGNSSCDLWNIDISFDAYKQMCATLAKQGTTSYLPTLITDSINNLKAKMSKIAQFSTDSEIMSNFYCQSLGFHIEGPFISKTKPGVHNPDFIIKPNKLDIENLIKNNNIKLMTLAFEEDDNYEVLNLLLNRNIALSIGHSNASYDQASSIFDRGVKLTTHLFNAMPPIHHRDPGLVTAALLNDNVTTCIIPDGLHIEKNIIKLIIKNKGINNCILVTDCAYIGTSQGGLVGSSLTLSQGIKNLVDWNIATFSQAIKMATYNCAKALKLDKRGSIKEKYYADIILWNKQNLRIEKVIINGLIN